MIQRIVLLKLKDEMATNEGRREVADHSRAVLRPIEGVESVAVAVASDPATATRWDVSLVLGFHSAVDLEPFRVHPEHRAYVDHYLRPKLAGIEAFNFEL